MHSGKRPPLRQWFSHDQAFPYALRGPVDFPGLRQWELNKAGARVGDLRSDMTLPPFQHPLIVAHNGRRVKRNPSWPEATKTEEGSYFHNREESWSAAPSKIIPWRSGIFTSMGGPQAHDHSE
jgi:hypothetical protein